MAGFEAVYCSDKHSYIGWIMQMGSKYIFNMG